MKIKTLLGGVAIATLAIFTSCSEHEHDDFVTQATFTGDIGGLINTRAYDTTWEAGDAIGIFGGYVNSTTEEDGFNVKYTTSTGGESGKFTPVSDAIKYVSTEPVYYCAYYPYYENNDLYSFEYTTDSYGFDYAMTTGIRFSVANDDGEQPETLKKKIDFLYAQGTGSMANPAVNFEFKHMMSQVQIQFVAGNGDPSLEGLSYTISGFYKNGIFDALGGIWHEDTDANLQSEKASITVTPEGITETDGSVYSTKTSSVLLIPGSIVEDGQLSLSIAVGDSNFDVTLKLPATTANKLLSGYSVKYIIKVNKSSAGVEGDATIQPWNYQNGDSEEVGVKSTGDVTDPSKVTKYALAFADGTYLNIYDSETSKFITPYSTDGTASALDFSSLSTAQKDACLGVVYWLGNPQKDDLVLANDYPGCTHGLIVAISNIYSHYYVWSNSNYDIAAWQLTQTDLYPIDYPDYDGQRSESYEGTSLYKSVGMMYGEEPATLDTKKLNMILGYNNSKILKYYNYTYATYTSYKLICYIAYLLKDFSEWNQSVKGSSGWFAPSAKELVLLYGETDNISFYSEQTFSDDKITINNLGNILSALKSIGVTSYGLTEYDVTLDHSYWTSTQLGNNYKYGCDPTHRAFLVELTNKGKVYDEAKESGIWIRFVSAF